MIPQLKAQIRSVDEVLDFMAYCEMETPEQATKGALLSFAGSSLWGRVAAKVLDAEDLVPLMFFHDAVGGGNRAVGGMLVTRDVANWRSGSPGQARLTWPFVEYGYHFAPRFRVAHAPGLLAGWLDAIAEILPGERLEFRRCAMDATVVPSKISSTRSTSLP